LIEELVLPGDVPVEATYGPPYSGLGDSVGWAGGVVAAAPEGGLLLAGGEMVANDAQWAGAWASRVVHVDATGLVHVDGVPTWEAYESTVFAAGEGGVVASDGERLYLLDRGRSVSLHGIVALGVGAERVVGVVCGERCVGEAWSFFGVSLGELAEAGEGGAAAEWQGIAWFGDPDEDDPDGRGRVRSEDGRELLGEPGDHLGMAIGGGYAAGGFNKWIVPSRARVVPLEAGPAYALERGGEDQPMALAGEGSTLVIGSPLYPHGSEPTGAVFVVER
jgi:hypothetical protein